MAAAVTVNREFNEGVPIWMQVVNVTTASATDYFDTKFKNVRFAWATSETTEKGIKVTKSGSRVTFAVTSGDVVDLMVIGDIN